MAVKIGTDPNIPIGRSLYSVVAITGYLQVANNLSDVQNAATSRSNLGIDLALYLQKASNLSDVADRATALSNLTNGEVAASANEVQLNHTGSRRAITHDQGVYFDRDVLKRFPEYQDFRKLDTQYKAHQTLAMNMQTMGAQAWYHEGTYRRVYFTFLGRLNWNAPIEYLTNYISYYDVDTGEIAKPVDLGVDLATLVDVHLMAFPFVSNDGYVHVMHETGKTGIAWDSNSQHNTNIIHKISDSPEDISSFTRVGAVTGSDESYPKYWKLSNGNIYGIYRNTGQQSVAIHYSDNNGSTWKNMAGTANTVSEILRLSGTDPYAYNMQVLGSASQGINIMVMDYEAATTPDDIDNLYFLHSDDGIIWENVNSWKSSGAGEFSKNILTVGSITQAELDANFKVPATATGVLRWNVRCGSITPGGIPVLQYAEENNTTGRIDNVYISYWNGSSWTHNEIREQIWGNEILCSGEGSIGKGHVIIPYSDTQWDMFVNFAPDGCGLPINDSLCMNYGNMTGDVEATKGHVFTGQRYIVVANDGLQGIPATLVAGDIYNCTNDGALNATNIVKPVRLGMKVMRTYNAGVDWHTVREWRSSSPFGMNRGATVNGNLMDFGKLFFFITEPSTKDRVYPDSSNIIIIPENIYNLMP